MHARSDHEYNKSDYYLFDPNARVCYVKRRTDALGGMKLYLGGIDGSLNPHGYAESRHVKKQPPPTSVLPGIPAELWNQFWDDMTKAEESGDITMVSFLMFVIALFVGTMLFLLLTPQLNTTWHVVVPVLALLTICIVGCCAKTTVIRWYKVINTYQPQFQQIGYDVAFLVEVSGQLSKHGGRTHSNLCHIWPISEEGNNTKNELI